MPIVLNSAKESFHIGGRTFDWAGMSAQAFQTYIFDWAGHWRPGHFITNLRNTSVQALHQVRAVVPLGIRVVELAE
jgi:hypothetical protein